MLLTLRAKISKSKGPKVPKGTRNRGPKEKLLADGREPTDLVPAKLDPAQAQEPLGAAPAEARNIAATIRDPPDRAKGNNWKIPLDVGIFLAKSEKLVKLCWAHTHLVELIEHLVVQDDLVEVDELDHEIDRSHPLRLKMTRGDVVVRPIVPTELHGILDANLVVHDNGVDVAHRLELLAGRYKRFAENTSKTLPIIRPFESDFGIDIARQCPQHRCLKLDIVPSDRGGSMLCRGCSPFFKGSLN